MNEKVDEVWCVARNVQNLSNVKKEFGDKIVTLPFDLSEQESIASINELLDKEQPSIAYLINNAGMGEELGSLFKSLCSNEGICPKLHKGTECGIERIGNFGNSRMSWVD